MTTAVYNAEWTVGPQKGSQIDKLTLAWSKFIPVQPTAKQLAFLFLPTLEALFGGAAGPGKSVGLLMSGLQYVDNPHYAALLLRKSYADLSLPGALMDKAAQWLGGTAAVWQAEKKTWAFPSGATLTFGYLDNTQDKYRYQSCFHPDTEILTEDGWVAVAEVKVGTKVASLDPETRAMSYEPVTDTMSYPFEGELISLDQRKGVAFAVTPNHNVWATTQKKRHQLRKFKADSLPQTARIPQWANWEGIIPAKEVLFQSPGNHGKTLCFTQEDWMSLLGWYLAEGSTWESRWQISISQTTAPGKTIIRNLLSLMGINYSEGDGAFTFNNRALCEYLHALGLSGTKYIPRDIKCYSRPLLLRLLIALVEGDGTWRDQEHKAGHFVTSSKRLADDVCEVAVKCGYRPTICERQGNPPESPFGQKPRWHVSLLRMDHDTGITSCSHGVNSGPSLMPYKGLVYCVTVPPHHTVLIRYKGRISWSGQSEFQFIGFDELTQFQESDYRYMFSRLRRLEGSDIPIRMRAASNPGNIGHVWVQQRFMVERNDDRVFLPARIEDNPYLDRTEYEKTLQELDPITRLQLLNGDWSARQSGNKFRREWFEIVDEAPIDCRWVRRWDMAATEPKRGSDPDYTAGCLMGVSSKRVLYIADIKRLRGTPGACEALVRQTAETDGRNVAVRMEQEPGSSGVKVIDDYTRRVLMGWDFQGVPSTGNKEVRANPLASQAEAGNVKLVRGPWINAFLDEIELFPLGSHDDQVDAASGALLDLTSEPEVSIGWI